MWIIYQDTGRGADFYKFYPCVQPDGDYGVDHLRVYVAPEIRAQLSDDIICKALALGMLKYTDGAETPRVGNILFTFDYYGDDCTNTINMDDDGAFADAMRLDLAGNA